MVDKKKANDKKGDLKPGDESIANEQVLEHYKTAGKIAEKVLNQVKTKLEVGVTLHEVCDFGDKLILQELEAVKSDKETFKGIAFPTSVSPNHIAANLSPLGSDPEAGWQIKAGDVVKVALGAHIDGYACCVADTVVVPGSGSSVSSDRIADVVLSAWYASEAAIKTIRPGAKNWDVTKVIDKVTQSYNCKALEGALSHQQVRNTFDGKKRVILNPSEAQRRELETCTFEENEVYGLDVLVTTGDGKVRPAEILTSVYKKSDLKYSLKLRTSRAIFSDAQKKAGNFPFSVRCLEDKTRARLGLRECQNHELVKAFEVHADKETQVIAQFYSTVAVTKEGVLRLSSPSTPDLSAFKTQNKISDESIVKLIG